VYWSINEMRLLDADGNRLPVNIKESFGDLRANGSDHGHFYQTQLDGLDKLVTYAGGKVDEFSRRIEEWQKPLVDSNLPAWLKFKLWNDLFPAIANTVFTRDRYWSVLESPVHMAGALGTMDQRMAAHAGWAMFWPDLDEIELRTYAEVQQKD